MTRDHEIQATLPLPIQIVIDDVGWWSGEDGSARQEPYRTGIERDHVPADYAAIVSLGRQLKMRPQAAFILCEWDRENILRTIPSSTWMGAAWDNSRWTGPWQDAAANIVRDGRDHLELTLHGLGHEFWSVSPDGTRRFSRAEWHDEQGQMRPRDDVLRRLDAFQRILAQHRLGEFPVSFVPCAFLHRFSNVEGNLASLLRRAGVRFISTPFQPIHGAEQITHGSFGFDMGLMTVDRGRDLLPWCALGAAPEGELAGPICGMHWPNLLHQNPERNEEVVSAWVRFLKACGQQPDRLLAPDTDFFAAQLAHHVCTKTELKQDTVAFDFTAFDRLPSSHLRNVFSVKIQSTSKLAFDSPNLDIVEMAESHSGAAFLHTVTLRRRGREPKASLHFRRAP